MIFPENVNVTLNDIGGLEPVEDILVGDTMPTIRLAHMTTVQVALISGCGSSMVMP